MLLIAWKKSGDNHWSSHICQSPMYQLYFMDSLVIRMGVSHSPSIPFLHWKCMDKNPYIFNLSKMLIRKKGPGGLLKPIPVKFRQKGKLHFELVVSQSLFTVYNQLYCCVGPDMPQRFWDFSVPHLKGRSSESTKTCDSTLSLPTFWCHLHTHYISKKQD